MTDMKRELAILKEIKNFSFGDNGTLQFYHQKFQEGYLQALEDITYLLETTSKEHE